MATNLHAIPQRLVRESVSPIVHRRPRLRGSKAFKTQQLRQTKRLERALNYQEHGKHIYGYRHFRTNQVVYSLTRVLDNNKALDQLIYHGKKTRPAALRRDVWTPYFSLHFPHPVQGLAAYRLLREFSLVRQLSPPQDMILNTEASNERIRRRKDPVDAEEWKAPKIGELMDKKLRAKALMNQKATSVADMAAVLLMQENEDPTTIDQRLKERRHQRIDNMSKNAKRRQRKRTELELQQAAKIRYRATVSNAYPFGVEYNIAKNRISREHDLLDAKQVELYREKRAEGDTTPQVKEEPSSKIKNQVQVYWADLDDSGYAEKWPGNVIHGELERMTVTINPQNGYEERSIHVIGKSKVYDEEGMEIRARYRLPPATIAVPELAEDTEGAEPAELKDDVEVTGEPFQYNAPPTEGVEAKPKTLAERTKDTLLFWRRR